jgi:MFS transporter, MHS family, proline/betaine transporter
MATTDLAFAPPVTPERRAKAKKATGVAVFGTFIEYYDFSVYGYVAATLAVVFFPSDDPAIGLLNTLLVFGSAFLVRPLGAMFFGWLGDRHGRRTSLIASIILMGAAAGLTGLLPGYAQIGVLAPILLIVLRMMQGFSTGGEIGGAASYIREWASPDRRSLYISFVPSFGNLGKGAAAGVAAIVALVLPGPAMESWGWRIPFLLAIPLAALVLYLRLQVEDSPEYVASKAEHRTTEKPIAEVFRHYKAPLAKVISISLVQNIGTYVGTVFVAVYWVSPRNVEASLMREAVRWPRRDGSSIKSSGRGRSGSCGRPASRSPGWPGSWGSTRARWGTGSRPSGGPGSVATAC